MPLKAPGLIGTFAYRKAKYVSCEAMGRCSLTVKEEIMDEVLEILEKDSRTTPEEIAKMLKKKPQVVKDTIKKYEKEGTKNK